MPQIVRIGSTFIALALLAACNTFEGAGEDIENAGEGIQDASQEVESSL